MQTALQPQVAHFELAVGRYENADVALNTGMILRAMLRHEPLAQILLYSDK